MIARSEFKSLESLCKFESHREGLKKLQSVNLSNPFLSVPHISQPAPSIPTQMVVSKKASQVGVCQTHESDRVYSESPFYKGGQRGLYQEVEPAFARPSPGSDSLSK